MVIANNKIYFSGLLNPSAGQTCSRIIELFPRPRAREARSAAIVGRERKD